MELETVFFQQDLFSYGGKDLHSNGGAGGGWSYDGFGLEEEKGCVEIFENLREQGLPGYLDSSPSTEVCLRDGFFAGEFAPAEAPVVTLGRRKRRRTSKDKEEVENQRMTHIAVERNRRKQMNEYLAVLRSLMPVSYVQRGDQASVVGGAINFVKELEQLLQSLEAKKQIKRQPNTGSSSPFPFFTFPPYTTHSTHCNNSNESMAKNRSAIADIEVTMVESHANVKVLSKRRPKQLLKMVSAFQNLHLTILHLNVTTLLDQMVLYSFSVKVEDECQLTTVDEIVDVVYEMLGRIQEEAMIS